MNPMLACALIGGLVLVAGALVTVVLSDVMGRKAAEAEAEPVPDTPPPPPPSPRPQAQNGTPLLPSLIVVAGCIVALCFYVNYKDDRVAEERAEAERNKRLEKVFNGLRAERVARPAPSTSSISSDDKLTAAAFRRLDTGMSYNEVCRILGGSGTLTSSIKLEGVPRTEAYQWEDGSRIVFCTFQDDRLVQKSQGGLR